MKSLSSFFLLLLAALAMPAAAQEEPGASDADTAKQMVDENSWLLDLSTGGRVTIYLRPDAAPKHVERIKQLTRDGFYDGIVFHRVIDGLMAQGGDPQGTGIGGSDYPDLEPETSRLPHVRGTVSMARRNDPPLANSQFFIMFQPHFAWDGKYTVFGRVVKGMEYVDTIARGEPPMNPSYIIQASLGDAPKPLPDFAALRGSRPPAKQPTAEELSAPLDN